MPEIKLNNKLILLAIVALLGLIGAYSNHFENGFHFDDTHTISYNTYIRDISNIPSFFTNIETVGTMPNNRSYRPVVTTLNAIDYWLAGDLEPFYFHLSIFLWYIAQLILMYFFFSKLFRLGLDQDRARIVAILSVVFYAFHTANAETINYVIMRSDSFSTLCVIASFLLYQNDKTRRLYLYLVTLVIGIATKESALMFVPLLFVYIALFEHSKQDGDNNLKGYEILLKSLLKSLPAIVVGILFFWFSRSYFRPEAGLFNIEHPSEPWKYFITQWFVIVHYIGNFILPLDLSADPDIGIIHTPLDQRVLFSLALIMLLLFIAYKNIRKHPIIAFGILWFFIALAPTSSIKPFGQISNDHRTFFPYIGLVISLGYFMNLIWEKYKTRILAKSSWQISLAVGYFLLITLHGIGVYQRNKVWLNEATLWKDVVEKSPNNGRGLMNYGLTRMQEGDYQGTLKLFERAMQLLPYYSYLHINMGVLKGLMGQPVEAEVYYRNALKFDRLNVEAYFFYAKFLVENNRKNEAIKLLEEGARISPGHMNTQNMLRGLKQKSDQLAKVEMALAQNPTSDGYIELSLMYYQNGQYQKCIDACIMALEILPENAQAYNNICSAYILLNNKEEAIKACNKALEIDPNFELAKNNLKWAETIGK